MTSAHAASTRRYWINFLGFCALFVAVEMSLDIGARCADRYEADFWSRQTELLTRMQPYELAPEFSTLDRDFGRGRPVPRRDVDHFSGAGPSELVEVDGSRFGPRYSGWKVEIAHEDRWRGASVVQVHPPLVIPRFSNAVFRRTAEQIRAGIFFLAILIIILSISAMPAGPASRGKMGQACMAGALLVLLDWFAATQKPAFWRPPEMNWTLGLGVFALITGLLVIMVAARRDSARADCCSVCGYNLTGNISGVCPECGTTTPSETKRQRDTQLETVLRALSNVSAESQPFGGDRAQSE